MANTEMIRDYIRASGYKMQYVARALKISPNALNLKLQGRTQFKLSEAERLSAVLGLSMYERDLCFFEEQNRREVLARRASDIFTAAMVYSFYFRLFPNKLNSKILTRSKYTLDSIYQSIIILDEFIQMFLPCRFKMIIYSGLPATY